MHVQLLLGSRAIYEYNIKLIPPNNICQVEREAVSKTLKETRFASLVVDGATDSAVAVRVTTALCVLSKVVCP